MLRPIAALFAAVSAAALLTAPAAFARPAADSEVGRVESAAARLRGLEPTRPVPVVALSRDAFRDMLVRDLAGNPLLANLDRTQAAWTLLGLLPPDLDLRATLLAVQAEQVTGFYRPQDGTIYLVEGDGARRVQQEIVLAHEYTHALQDQHYGMATLTPSPAPSADQALARRALVEGDATITMQRYAAREVNPLVLGLMSLTGGLPSQALQAAPAALQGVALFPYVEGAAFVGGVQADAGAAGLDATFRRPPDTTEQVLHPDKYAAAEPAVPVALPPLAAALGGTWQERGGDVLGEAGLRLLLRGRLDAATADAAAAGWGGDRWSLLRDATGRQALVLATAWDTSADAAEFFAAFGAVQQQRYGSAAGVTLQAPSELELATPDGLWRIQASDTDVLVLLAPDGETLAALRAALAA